MNSHVFAEGADRCTHCGTLQTQTERTACPGGYVAPTVRAIPASVVNDDLTTRLAELRAEREAAWNSEGRE